MPTTAVPAGEYNGNILVPTNSSSVTTPDGYAPTVEEYKLEQIQEINNGYVVGTDQNDQVEAITDIPLYENEQPIRKRLVKVVNGKIVDSRIVYIRRQVISASGQQYIFLLPDVDPLTEAVNYTPMRIFLP